MNPDILAILETVQIFMDYLAQNGGSLNREAQDQLANFIQESIAFVEDYNQMQQQQAQPEIPIPPQQPPEDLEQAMPSSNISAFAYDNTNNRLLVQFLGKHPNRNGPIYSYSGVPHQIFELFRRGAIPARTEGRNAWGSWWKGKVPSAGASMYTLIKTAGYPYQRVA